MITLRNIHRSFRMRNKWKHVLRGVDLDVPDGASIGILGRNGAGKSTLMNIISGTDSPDTGIVRKNGRSISWPIGRGGMQGSLTAVDNIKFVCRIMGKDPKPAIDFVTEFSELGEYMYMPVKTYSGGMRARLGFAISMAFQYDCYLVDEGFNAGDARFTERTEDLFKERLQHSSLLVVTHSVSIIQKLCNQAAVLRDGQLTMYDDIDEAIKIYKTL